MNLSQMDLTLSEAGKQPVVLPTDSFVGVEGIKVLSQGLGDGPCLAPVEQDWEDVSPVKVHLGSCVNMGPPDTLFKEAEASSRG